jgi:outer membrane cobalamin receptor
MDEGRKRVASDAGSGMLLLLPFPAWPQATPPDLTSLSLEDLMNTKVTSASKTEQRISRTASAIFVITAADMHGAHDTALEQG